MEEMEKNISAENTENDDVVEYEEVKKLSMGAFIGIGLAFGVAAGFSVGNLLVSQMFMGIAENGFILGMGACVVLGLIGGFILGIVNKNMSKK